MRNKLTVFVVVSFVAGLSAQNEKSCTTSSECPKELSCIDLKCGDPCESICGLNTVCTVSNNNASCSCMPGFTPGYDIDARSMLTEDITSCIPMTCTTNSDCPEELGCFFQNCSDPCPIICGQNTICKAVDHNATCTCKPGFTGGYDIDVRTNMDEMFTDCVPIIPAECTSNAQCPVNKACIDKTCEDPCSLVNCGLNTVCQTHNNLAMCSCMPGSTGNPISGCRLGRDQGVTEQTPKTKKFYVEKRFKSDWPGSLLNCQNQGYRLASIETSEENTEVLHLIKQTNLKLTNFWIAGTDKDQEGRWVWNTTGKLVSLTTNGFSYWQRGQPDNLFNEDCLGYMQLPVIGLIMKSGYWWNDYHCSWNSYFICEYYE